MIPCRFELAFISEPWLRRERRISVLPVIMATCRSVSPLSLIAEQSRLCCSRILSMSGASHRAAECNSCAISTSAVKKNLTISKCSMITATWNGVFLCLFRVNKLPPLYRSCFTASACPFSAARCNAVSWFCSASLLRESKLRRNSIISMVPLAAAWVRGIRPWWLWILNDVLFRSSSLMISRSSLLIATNNALSPRQSRIERLAWRLNKYSRSRRDWRWQQH